MFYDHTGRFFITNRFNLCLLVLNFMNIVWLVKVWSFGLNIELLLFVLLQSLNQQVCDWFQKLSSLVGSFMITGTSCRRCHKKYHKIMIYFFLSVNTALIVCNNKWCHLVPDWMYWLVTVLSEDLICVILKGNWFQKWSLMNIFAILRKWRLKCHWLLMVCFM